MQVAQFVGPLRADLRRDVGVLKQERALEKLPAVQSAAKDEVPFEERAGLPEEREQIFALEPPLARSVADGFAAAGVTAVARHGDDFDFHLRTLGQG